MAQSNCVPFPSPAEPPSPPNHAVTASVDSRTIYDRAAQQLRFFLREDHLPSPSSSSPTHAAASSGLAGGPRHPDMLSVLPVASTVLTKRRISVLESIEDEPSKRMKVTRTDNDGEPSSSTPPAIREASPRLDESVQNQSIDDTIQGPVRSSPEAVDDDNILGSQSSLDCASEVELKPDMPLIPASVLSTHVSFTPVSSPFLDALLPPATHTPPRRACIPPREIAENATLNSGRSSEQGSGASASPSPPHTSPGPLAHKDYTLDELDGMIKSREDLASEMEARAAELVEAARKLREQGRQLKELGKFVRLGTYRGAGGGKVEAEVEKGGVGA